jgi:hypothetical protein
MNIYIYVNMYIDIYSYVYSNIHMNIYIYKYIGVCTFVEKSKGLGNGRADVGLVVNTDDTLTDMPSGKGIYICVYTYIFIYIYLYTYIYIHIYVYIYIYIKDDTTSCSPIAIMKNTEGGLLHHAAIKGKFFFRSLYSGQFCYLF